MLKVKSLIEKEIELEDAIEENHNALSNLLEVLENFSKKKPENIRYILCGNNV